MSRDQLLELVHELESQLRDQSSTQAELDALIQPALVTLRDGDLVVLRSSRSPGPAVCDAMTNYWDQVMQPWLSERGISCKLIVLTDGLTMDVVVIR